MIAMPAMSGIYRVLAWIAVAAALVGFGYVQGIRSEFDRHEERYLKINKAAADQEAKTSATIRRQKEITQENANAYAGAVSALTAHYDRRLRDTVRRGAVPTVPSTETGRDERSADAGSCAEGDAAAASLEILKAKCAGTTLQFLYLRDFVEQQQQEGQDRGL